MTTPEQLAGITYAEVGIDVSRYRSGKNHKTTCPSCGPTRKNPQDRSLSVDMEKGQWHCHNCNWNSGLILERRAHEGVAVR